MLGREESPDLKPPCASKMSDYEENEDGGFWILSARLDFETSGWSDGVTWLGGSPKVNLGYHIR